MRRIASLYVSSAILTLGFAAAPALAQTTTDPAAQADAQAEPQSIPEEIVVTGSRIRRDPLDQPSPVVTVDDSAIAKTGLSNVADVLQRLPASSGGLNSKFNSSGNFGNPPDGGGVGAGSAVLDLRYLGPKRTLVLVDGLRYVNGASASGIPATVDLNSIPSNMIERIEVLQSGASPQYGSDAIAGVVNIITKTNQNGLKASAQYGQFLGDNDGKTQDYQLSYGIGSQGVHVVAGGYYTKQEAVGAADRAISQFPTPGITACDGSCSSFTPLGRFLVNGQSITLRGPVSGRPVYDPTLATGDFKPFTTADRFNFAPFNYFITPVERYGGFVNARAEFSDALNLTVKAVYNRRNSQNKAAFLPLGIGPDVANGNALDTFSVDATNPYNPFGVTLTPGVNYTGIFRRLIEAGQRTYNQTVDTMSLTGTLDGKFQMFGHNWYWDVNAVIGLNDAKQLFTGNVNIARLQQAIGPISQCTGACVPFNFFGGVGSITPEMIAFVGFDERDRSRQRLNDYTANLSGELFDLPGGPVGLAVGYEHRFQYGSFTPDPVIQAGLGADIPAAAASGRFSVDEVYGEVRLPLLKDIPFINSLELNGAVRYSDYSTFGGNTTFSGGGLWKPVRDLLFRGQYAESLRAPSIGELNNQLSRFDATINDPCTSAAGGLFQSNSTVRANCIANGVPADGSYAEPQGGQLPVFTRGNPDLQPESARTLLFGAVYSPRWARQGALAALSLEANYYDIKVSNAINAVPAQTLLGRCAQAADAFSCASIRRTASGIVAAINGQLINTGGIRTKGIDATFTLRTNETGAGRFGLYISGNYLLKYAEIVPATDGFTTIEYKGTERGSPDQAYPRFKGLGTIDWTLGPVTASATGRYIDAVDEIDFDNKLNSRFYTDLQLQIRPSWWDERLALTIGVNNVFDKDPPACFSCSLNNFDPTTYDIPGRFGYLRLSFGL